MSSDMRIFSNSAMSADGKLATVLHDHVAIGSAEDRRRMSLRRAEADAVIVGGQTFRNWPIPLVENPAHVPGKVARTGPMVNLVLTRRGIAAVGSERWPDPRVQLVIQGGPELDRAAHEAAFPGAIIHPAETDPSEADLSEADGLPRAIRLLSRMGCRSILIEGGGALIFEALKANLLDELYLTVCPLIIGGKGAPTPAEGVGFSAADTRRLRLGSAETIGDEVFLRYAVIRPPR